MKKFLALIFVPALFLLGGCIPLDSGLAATDLSGTWVAELDNGVGFQADVTATDISVSLTMDESSALYWKGTFAGEDVTEGQKITSDADVEALSKSLFGSQDETKVFTYKDGQLTFPFSIMGVSQTVKLVKQ